MPQAVQDDITQAAKDQGVSSDLLFQVANAESSLNPNVSNSSAGAQGLFQFMPGTAKDLGIDPMDPKQASQGAGKYLHQLLGQFNGNTEEAVAAYNWGPGNVQQDVAAHGNQWMYYLPAETRNYIAKVLGE